MKTPKQIEKELLSEGILIKELDFEIAKLEDEINDYLFSGGNRYGKESFGTI
ncbi:hypothetical protein D3C74_347730 [compost metagenome]